MKYEEAMTMLKEFETLCVKYESIHFYIGFIQSNLARLIETKSPEHSIRVIQKAIDDYRAEKLIKRFDEIDQETTTPDTAYTSAGVPGPSQSQVEICKNIKP